MIRLNNINTHFELAQTNRDDMRHNANKQFLENELINVHIANSIRLNSKSYNVIYLTYDDFIKQKTNHKGSTVAVKIEIKHMMLCIE